MEKGPAPVQDHAAVIGPLDADPHRLDGGQGRSDIGPVGQAVDHGGPLGQRSKQDGPVRDRLLPRRPYRASARDSSLHDENPGRRHESFSILQ
jgi:hypothetical protein